ncbi:MAG: hypothetical protein M1829_001005 [Trizodia sp. TS-e1964]|nr:MAG: hypothetical protein M1829_001005 [Trizodia sp. TS-e1964]
MDSGEEELVRKETPSRLTLLTMPGEIRNRIYQYSFNLDKTFHTIIHNPEGFQYPHSPEYSPSFWPNNDLAILRVCKQTHQEASSVFYALARFRISEAFIKLNGNRGEFSWATFNSEFLPPYRPRIPIPPPIMQQLISSLEIQLPLTNHLGNHARTVLLSHISPLMRVLASSRLQELTLTFTPAFTYVLDWSPYARTPTMLFLQDVITLLPPHVRKLTIKLDAEADDVDDADPVPCERLELNTVKMFAARVLDYLQTGEGRFTLSVKTGPLEHRTVCDNGYNLQQVTFLDDEPIDTTTYEVISDDSVRNHAAPEDEPETS